MAETTSNLRTYLLSVSAVSTIFGTRIYVNRKDQKITIAYPYAIIRTINEAPGYTLSGALPPNGTYQIDIYSTSITTADTGKAAIRTAVSAYKGAMSGITVGSSFIVDERGDYDEEGRVHRHSIDLAIGQNG